MALDVGPLDGDFIRPHIDGANDGRHGQLQNEKGPYQDRGLLVSRRPCKRKRRQDGDNEEPAQRKRNLCIHVIRAGHEGVRVEQKIVVAEKKQGRKTQQQEPRR